MCKKKHNQRNKKIIRVFANLWFSVNIQFNATLVTPNWKRYFSSLFFFLSLLFICNTTPLSLHNYRETQGTYRGILRNYESPTFLSTNNEPLSQSDEEKNKMKRQQARRKNNKNRSSYEGSLKKIYYMGDLHPKKNYLKD